MSRPAVLLREEQKIEDVMQSRARRKFQANEAGGPREVDQTNDAEERPIGNQPAWPTVDPEMFYGTAGRFVDLVDPQTEADPVAVLVQFQALFGNIIGRSAYFLVEGARHYANVFVLIVGRTSKGRKQTALNHCLNVFSRVDESYVTRCLYSGMSSGEGLIASVRDPTEERQPIKEKGRVVDYQVVITDHGVDDKRLVAVEAEFASPVARMGRDGSTLSAVIRQSFDTGNLRVMTRNNPVRATGAHISIIAHITNDELHRVFDRTELANGFANRFVFVGSRRSKLLPLGGAVSDSSLNDIVSKTREAIDFARTVHEVRFDDEARAFWFEKYASLSASRPGMLGAVTSRSEAYVLRLSLIYALLDCSPVIRYGHLNAAIALWKYCEDSARYIFGDALGDRLADEILGALREAAEVGLTRTQIRDIFRRNVEADRIGSALKLLAENGLARSRKESGDGRPVERWFAVERVRESSVGVEEVKVRALPDVLVIPRECPSDEESIAACIDAQRI
jgi:hypothetical protein